MGLRGSRLRLLRWLCGCAGSRLVLLSRLEYRTASVLPTNGAKLISQNSIKKSSKKVTYRAMKLKKMLNSGPIKFKFNLISLGPIRATQVQFMKRNFKINLLLCLNRTNKF